MSARDQRTKSSDSTCAQLCSNAETGTETMAPAIRYKEYKEDDEQFGMHEQIKVQHECTFSSLLPCHIRFKVFPFFQIMFVNEKTWQLANLIWSNYN